MKTKNKAFLLAISAILVVIATAFGTIAYLTSEITVTHTFTVGDVEVNLTIDNMSTLMFNGENIQDGNARTLVPNHEYNVPVSVNIGDASEDAWVFVQVINPLEDIEAGSGVTTLADTQYKTLEEQMASNKWAPLSYEGAAVDGVYYFNDTSSENGHVVKAGSVLPVYDHFKISHTAKGGTVAEAIAELNEENTDTDGAALSEAVTLSEAESKLYLGEYKDKKIMVIVYVVQADGLNTVDAAWSVFEKQYEKNVSKYVG